MTAELRLRQKMTSLYTRRESFRLFVSSADQTTTVCLCVSAWAQYYPHPHIVRRGFRQQDKGWCCITITSDWLTSDCQQLISLHQFEFQWLKQMKPHLQVWSFLEFSPWKPPNGSFHGEVLAIVKCPRRQHSFTHLQTLSWKPIAKPCRQVLKAFCFVVKCVLKKDEKQVTFTYKRN